MKTRIGVFLLAVLLLLTCKGTGRAGDTGVGVSPGQQMPDFTVSLTDGSQATLSEILKEKELVVLNVFASWCVPCKREFPEMELVYQENKDRMEILAVSAEPADTMEIIADYKAGYGLSFPMGLAGDALSFLQVPGFPTSILIDREGKVGMVKVGAFLSREEFEERVNYFLSADYSGDPLVSERAVNYTRYILCYLLLSTVLLVIGRWGIFRKGGKRGWHSLIPFLSTFQEYALAWKGWLGLVAGLCTPLGMLSNLAGLPAGIYYCLVALRLFISIPENLKLSKAFGKGRIFGLLMVLPVFKEVGRMVLGWGKAEYHREDR